MIATSQGILEVPMWQNMLSMARQVARNAYNPYSGYFVGAVLRSVDGELYQGTFLENGSYGHTVCAEVVAIATANTSGISGFHSIAVVGGYDESDSEPPCTPCGGCRQVMLEFAARGSNSDPLVVCSNLALTNVALTTVSDLLPSAWMPRRAR